MFQQTTLKPEVEDVSQEYIDQAKGTAESELDEKTSHVNKNIEKIDKELDTRGQVY